MNVKVIIAVVVIVIGVVLGVISFSESNIEYTNFDAAARTKKKVQVKGEWIREMDSGFKSEIGQFIFYMKDDNNKIAKVVLKGAKPNNFEVATSIVVKGKYMDDAFYATEVLTKCPSKYEGDSKSVQRSL